MSSVDDNHYTTDAVPSPPRDENTENIDNGCTYEKENIEEEPKRNNGHTSQGGYKRPSNYTMINVSHSNNVHVGSNTTVVINSKKNDSKKKLFMTDDVRALMKNKTKLSTKNMEFLSQHIGEGWKSVARRLDYSEGQINQFIIDHQERYGIKEVIYQFLLAWYRNEPESATVATLAGILWEEGEKDAVIRWSKEKHENLR